MTTCAICTARARNRGTISDPTPPDQSCRACEASPTGQCGWCKANDPFTYCRECGCGYAYPSALDDRGVCEACRERPGWQHDPQSVTRAYWRDEAVTP